MSNAQALEMLDVLAPMNGPALVEHIDWAADMDAEDVDMWIWRAQWNGENGTPLTLGFHVRDLKADGTPAVSGWQQLNGSSRGWDADELLEWLRDVLVRIENGTAEAWTVGSKALVIKWLQVNSGGYFPNVTTERVVLIRCA